tara:strand:+ start:412 stop:855 length:444 start_codon:yes stop_codon:yes gene_type:complete
LNTKVLKELKKEFIDSLLDKSFEVNDEVNSLKKHIEKEKRENDKTYWPQIIFHKKKKSLQLLSLFIRVYKLDLQFENLTEGERKTELYSIKAFQKSFQTPDLMTIFVEELGRWVLKTHPTFYAGTLRIINEIDSQETLLELKSKKVI